MMNYNSDVLNNTLTVSEKFLKAAGKYNSAEYNVVKQLRADNPNMQIVVEKKQQKSANKNLTFKQMEEFSMVVDADKKTQFEMVKKISKVQSSPYHYVKTWFEHQFPHYTEQVVFGEDGTITFVKKDDKKESTDTQEAPAAAENIKEAA